MVMSTLDPHQLRQACTYTNRQGQRRRPRWKGQGKGDRGQGSKDQTQSSKQRRYYPSFNTAPQAVTPVLVSSQHFKDEEGQGVDTSVDDRVLTDMKWGLVPSWHKGDPNAMAYKMNNCRSEGLMQKASFKRPFEHGRRCVVLADGFYEWHTGPDKKKQPYFIYFTQDSPPTELRLPESEDEFDPDSAATEGGEVKEWNGHRVLTMAGIFDKWNPPEGGDPLYSYSIITIASSPCMSWIHHRMPVMLDSDEAVRDWLDFGNVPASKALSMLKPVDCLSCHPVTPRMGNTRYKDPDCIRKIDPEESKKPTNTFMNSWLKAKSGEQKPSVGQNVIKEEEAIEKKVKVEKKTGLTSWLQKANKAGTLKRAMESASPEKKRKVVKSEVV